VLDGIDRHTSGKDAITLEGRIVRFADHIAYINHDIDDAVRAGVLREEDIPSHLREILGYTKSERINTMVMSLINSSDSDIKMAEPVYSAYKELNAFLFDRVYTNMECKAEETKVKGIIEGLFSYYIKNPDKVTGVYKTVAEKEGLERAVTDLVGGMTDTYALEKYSEIYIPKSWNI
jgi:dGTPase